MTPAKDQSVAEIELLITLLAEQFSKKPPGDNDGIPTIEWLPICEKFNQSNKSNKAVPKIELQNLWKRWKNLAKKRYEEVGDAIAREVPVNKIWAVIGKYNHRSSIRERRYSVMSSYETSSRASSPASTTADSSGLRRSKRKLYSTSKVDLTSEYGDLDMDDNEYSQAEFLSQCNEWPSSSKGKKARLLRPKLEVESSPPVASETQKKRATLAECIPSLALMAPPPLAVPTAVRAASPSVVPTAVPAALSSAVPTAVRAALPSAVPTAVPAPPPSVVPTAVAAPSSMVVLTAVPSALPPANPTSVSARVPSAVPANLIETANETLRSSPLSKEVALRGDEVSVVPRNGSFRDSGGNRVVIDWESPLRVYKEAGPDKAQSTNPVKTSQGPKLVPVLLRNGQPAKRTVPNNSNGNSPPGIFGQFNTCQHRSLVPSLSANSKPNNISPMQTVSSKPMVLTTEPAHGHSVKNLCQNELALQSTHISRQVFMDKKLAESKWRECMSIRNAETVHRNQVQQAQELHQVKMKAERDFVELAKRHQIESHSAARELHSAKVKAEQEAADQVKLLRREQLQQQREMHAVKVRAEQEFAEQMKLLREAKKKAETVPARYAEELHHEELKHARELHAARMQMEQDMAERSKVLHQAKMRAEQLLLQKALEIQDAQLQAINASMALKREIQALKLPTADLKQQEARINNKIADVKLKQVELEFKQLEDMITISC